VFPEELMNYQTNSTVEAADDRSIGNVGLSTRFEIK
jgi:hypothetical protein